MHFTTVDFNQGFEPKDFSWPKSKYSDFTQEISRISTKLTSAFLPFEVFDKGVTKAPVTEVVRFYP
jgi:hypothetical protein